MHLDLKCMKSSLIYLFNGRSISYSFLSQRVNQCLRDACHNSDFRSCGSLIDCSHVGSILDQTKWRENEKAAACFNPEGAFSYGIYTPAVHLTTRDSMTKYLYSLFWGFQVPYILSYVVCDRDMFSCLYNLKKIL